MARWKKEDGFYVIRRIGEWPLRDVCVLNWMHQASNTAGHVGRFHVRVWYSQLVDVCSDLIFLVADEILEPLKD